MADPAQTSEPKSGPRRLVGLLRRSNPTDGEGVVKPTALAADDRTRRRWLPRWLRRGPGTRSRRVPMEGSVSASVGPRRGWSQLFRRRHNRRVQARPPLPSSARETAPPSSRRNGLRVALSVIALAATGGGMSAGLVALHRFLTLSPHFAVREVRISPTVHANADTLRARAGVAAGVNLFAVDLEQVMHRIQADPWVSSAHVRRELPGVIDVQVKERQPACVVALGALYLADPRGEVFKRATPEEAASLPVVSGITRDGYVDDREASQTLIREGLAALEAWRREPGRPALGEIHVDAASGITIYLRKDGVVIRLGHGDVESLATRVRRMDAVFHSLADTAEKPRLILVDQRSHTDRVTVRLASN